MKISVALLSFLCLFLLETFTSGLDKSCLPGWYKEACDNCYYIGNESINYDEANQRCKSMHSQLFPVDSQSDQDQLISLLGKISNKCGREDNCHEFWIGVRGGTRDWPNQIWAPGYPTDEGDCVFLSVQKGYGEISGHWKNDRCTRLSKFVCYTKAQSKKEIPPLDPDTQDKCPDVTQLIKTMTNDFKHSKDQIIHEVKTQMTKDAEKIRKIIAGIKLKHIKEKVDIQLKKQLKNIENLIRNSGSISQPIHENPEDEGCPDGFDYVPEIDQCLYLNLERQTWSNARDACASIAAGAELVMIKNSVKQHAVRKYLKPKFTREESDVCINKRSDSWGKIVWMGGQTSDPDQCNTPYVWKPLELDETPFTYTNWNPGAPNCYYKGENCAILTTAPKFNYQWEDFACKAALCSVCEI